jgi:hypothetical protein
MTNDMRKMPYWGMRGGDLIAYLNEKGFESYAASVSPFGSAWDRACELYYTGKKTPSIVLIEKLGRG